MQCGDNLELLKSQPNELERLFNSKGSSTWDEADALDVVATTIEQELIKGESTADISNILHTIQMWESIVSQVMPQQENNPNEGDNK